MTEYCPTDCANLVCGVCCGYKQELAGYTLEDDRRHYERLPECATTPFPPEMVEWHGMDEKPELQDGDYTEHIVRMKNGKITFATFGRYSAPYWTEGEGEDAFSIENKLEAWACLPGRSKK